MTFQFQVVTKDPNSAARVGRIETPHGSFTTPAFMPVGTQATVKGLFPEQVSRSGAEIILANTYHLHLRPGEGIVREMGGLHRFMGWSGPILTDSGGYQVFSLAHRRTITEEGVEFRSHIDGSRCFLGPKEAMEIQIALGADIIMSFDECLPYPIEKADAQRSVDRTSRWEEETLRHHPHDGRAVFGIVQGSVYTDLRERSARALLAMPFDGYAAGGLFVGEEREQTMEVLALVGAVIPSDYPRYVMGVGTPVEILDAVLHGWDMFDCVLPTRNGRHGQAMTRDGFIRLKNAKFSNDARPLAEECPCLACYRYSRAYLRHLIMADEPVGASLISHHNITYMQQVMAGAREAIRNGNLRGYREEIAAAQNT